MFEYMWIDFLDVSESDKRKLKKMADTASSVYGIYADHIEHLEKEETKKQAIQILWDICNHVEKILDELGEINWIKIKKEIE